MSELLKSIDKAKASAFEDLAAYEAGKMVKKASRLL